MPMRSSLMAAAVTLPLLGAGLVSGGYTPAGLRFPTPAAESLQPSDRSFVPPAQARKINREAPDSRDAYPIEATTGDGAATGIAGREARDARHARRLALLEVRRSGETDLSQDDDRATPRDHRRARRLGAS